MSARVWDIKSFKMCIIRLAIKPLVMYYDIEVHLSFEMISLSSVWVSLWYAGIAVPQVLQYLREFDAPAMQSCKPLPCGTGSWQNRRLREQTLSRKPCHCGSIKGGWCMELPISLDQPLHGQIGCACLDMFLPVCDLYLLPERAASNLQKPAALKHFLLAASIKCTTAWNTMPDRPSPGLSRTTLLDLIFRRQWKIS